MSAPGGCLLQGVSAPGEVSAPRGGVSAPEGCLLQGGVCSRGGCLFLEGVCLGVSAHRVPAPGGCLLWGCGIPACTEADIPPCEQNDRQV